MISTVMSDRRSICALKLDQCPIWCNSILGGVKNQIIKYRGDGMVVKVMDVMEKLDWKCDTTLSSSG